MTGPEPSDDADPITGPVLFLDDLRDGLMHLAALFIAPGDAVPGPVETEEGTVAPVLLACYQGARVYRARFTRPADRPSDYRWNGRRHQIAGGLTGDLRIAYVSCNGEEHGDLHRDGSERNAMWARLEAEHAARPFALLLHGGDQVYADEETRAHPLSADWPERLPSDPSQRDLADLREVLRERFFARYAALYRAPEFARIAACVPSLMQWDDHDICDGWGSLPRSRSYSPVGQTLFSVAREAFLVFQQAAAGDDLPARFTDRAGLHLGWRVSVPGLRIVAPDLRSERTRRQVMGPEGWRAMEEEAARPEPGRMLLMSSVPLLGPRLSLLEMLMVAVPRMQKYEDDLRDQWQSRAHRASWKRMLRLVRDTARRERQEVTVLSGEIHVATRAVMEIGGGLLLHQLVSSGIAHRAPPKSYARALGALAWLGEGPLPGHPIRIERIPGQRARYLAERNYLILARDADRWSASWDLEGPGRSPPLPL